MSNHRYIHLLQPMDRFVRALTPRGRRYLLAAETLLVLTLSASVFVYVNQ